MRILYLAYTVVVNGCNLIGSALPQPLAQILHLRTRWFNPSQLVLVAFSSTHWHLHSVMVVSYNMYQIKLHAHIRTSFGTCVCWLSLAAHLAVVV